MQFSFVDTIVAVLLKMAAQITRREKPKFCIRYTIALYLPMSMLFIT